MGAPRPAGPPPRPKTGQGWSARAGAAQQPQSLPHAGQSIITHVVSIQWSWCGVDDCPRCRVLMVLGRSHFSCMCCCVVCSVFSFTQTVSEIHASTETSEIPQATGWSVLCISSERVDEFLLTFYYCPVGLLFYFYDRQKE